MRTLRLVFFCAFILFISGFAFGLDLKVRVVDPSSAAVSGARVSVFQGGSQSVAVATSDARGEAVLVNLKGSSLQLEVLAPGFARFTAPVSVSGQMTAKLSVSTNLENVVVSATPTPVEAGLTGLSVSALDETQLAAMQPVAISDALRFLPGVVLGDAGARGGQTSLFVRGGESDYNKVLVDGVPVSDPGGYFDFGNASPAGVGRLELMRGPESVLYGSDAMSSVLQIDSAAGHTRTPELRLGADGGNFGTAHGYAQLSGTAGRYDYNVFGDQLVSNGQGANAYYSNSSEGANLGMQISGNEALRLHLRHNTSSTGVPGEIFPGLPAATDAWAHQNNLLAALDWTKVRSNWQQQLTVYNYNHQRQDTDLGIDAWRTTPAYGYIDYPFADFADYNHFGVRYSGEVSESRKARTSYGYEFEDENGFFGDHSIPSVNHGLRLNHAVYAEQFVEFGRLTAIAGARFAHNESFGNRWVPRASITYLVARGNKVFSGTRLKGSYSEGIKAPSFEESYGFTGYGVHPNPNLKPEQARSFDAGVEQKFGSKVSATASYFNNLYRDRITTNGLYTQYINLNKALAHGAEAELSARLSPALRLNGGYTYTSTQILASPLGYYPSAAGNPLLRRPKHSGSVLLSYEKQRYGATLGGSFVGRRPDSDFLGYGLTHAPGFARVDAGAWCLVRSRMTLYANVENLLNRHYEEVLGYPALTATVRAGVRFRYGGE